MFHVVGCVFYVLKPVLSYAAVELVLCAPVALVGWLFTSVICTILLYGYLYEQTFTEYILLIIRFTYKQSLASQHKEGLYVFLEENRYKG